MIAEGLRAEQGCLRQAETWCAAAATAWFHLVNQHERLRPPASEALIVAEIHGIMVKTSGADEDEMIHA